MYESIDSVVETLDNSKKFKIKCSFIIEVVYKPNAQYIMKLYKI